MSRNCQLPALAAPVTLSAKQTIAVPHHPWQNYRSPPPPKSRYVKPGLGQKPTATPPLLSKIQPSDPHLTAAAVGRYRDRRLLCPRPVGHSNPLEVYHSACCPLLQPRFFCLVLGFGSAFSCYIRWMSTRASLIVTTLAIGETG